MGVREIQKQATRRKVLDAARDLFDQDGFEETTIRAIAERAGVSVGSVFTTFSSKADVLSQVMQDRLEALYGEIEAMLAGQSGTTAERISAMFHLYFRFETRRVKLFLAHIAASYATSRDPAAIPYGRNPRAKEIVRQMLTDGMARGEVRPDADMELVIEMLLAAYAWNYHHAAASGEADLEEMTSTMDRQVRLLFDGLAPRGRANAAM